MNIYFFERNSNIWYDEADSMVIIAESAESAKNIIEKENCYGDEGLSVWVEMEPELVGISNLKEEKLLCVSFNAG